MQDACVGGGTTYVRLLQPFKLQNIELPKDIFPKIQNPTKSRQDVHKFDAQFRKQFVQGGSI
jgi:hypothetical protein